jgi:hypothetical protein
VPGEGHLRIIAIQPIAGQYDGRMDHPPSIRSSEAFAIR